MLVEHELVAGATVLEELGRALRTKMRVPDDAVVLGEAVEGTAEVLVTGDGDLLAVSDDSPIPVISPRGFWRMLQEGYAGRPLDLLAIGPPGG